MAKVTFYPLGNADCCLVDLNNEKKFLIDYANHKDTEDEDDLRIDLQTELLNNLEAADKDFFDVVAFTHADEDHVRGASNFFEFDHAEKYQGGDRIKIEMLWVPVGFLLETGLKNDARVIQAEAKHRLIKGYGVRIFSRPNRLKEWLNDNNIKLDDRMDFITDAGEIVPDFDKVTDEIELFAHSPFAFRTEDTLEDRNEGSLVFHATFEISGNETKMMFAADSTWDVLSDIVNITRDKNREERLEWDIFKLPHHCSYRALADEKGETETEPDPDVSWLFEQGRRSGFIISTSNLIPDEDTEQPPHIQAANYYKKITKKYNIQFKVTMEHPKASSPEPIEITIDNFGASLKMAILAGGLNIGAKKAPRAGRA